jgi:transformer-2 protein
VLGVFGLSIRTQERDLDDEFSRFGRVEKVTIVYDQRVCDFLAVVLPSIDFGLWESGRSRGFGFIKMSTVEDATKCIQELNGVVRHCHVTSSILLLTPPRRSSMDVAFALISL